MVASRLIDVALVVAAAAAAAAAATSAAGRRTHDSYGLKLDRAVVVTGVIGAGCRWLWTTDVLPGGEPLFEQDDEDDESDGERLSRPPPPPPPPWSEDDDDVEERDDDVFLWWLPILSEFVLPFCGAGASDPI